MDEFRTAEEEEQDRLRDEEVVEEFYKHQSSGFGHFVEKLKQELRTAEIINRARK